ncbi:trypsin-like peptidase domain-containing protein [Bacillus sp. EB600]|uniref:trypsin-like peptidase domain-containing protein n=1 Tax=Bacillus sp. EB600 TaxID=2806345 RepID=UPI002109F39D|nr:trypsin-like peptidase domain-containing protein [Bacillus sp. EB600]MCQ6282667.1 trypsin-like peptidase domain-containing protein [Bacillus sp. EB600]
MYCHKCGTNVVDSETRFCPKCGTQLNVEPRSPISVESTIDYRTTKLKRRRSLFWSITIPVFFLLCAVIVGSFYYYQQNHVKQESKKTTSPIKAVHASSTIKKTDVPKDVKSVIEETQKDVVMIEVDNSKLGSGFLYNKSGDIITNAHVVEGAQNVKITTSDSRDLEGTVIGISQDVDIAVVRVPGMANNNPLSISNKKAEIGDEVLALGSPLGLQNTVTTGIISGVGRDFDIAPFHYSDTYQISAPIAPGNSGGPLINSKTAQVLGINTAGADQGTIGFSIPIVNVLSLVESWSKTPMTELPSDSTTKTDQNSSNSSFEVTAQDLVNSFYQSINNRDYVTAYSLLGSSWKEKTSYTKFQNGYLNTISSNIEILNTVNNGDTVTVTILIYAVEENQGNHVSSKYQVDYTIGYENGHLKLFHGTGKKIE